MTPTRPANGAPGVGCLKWPHTCLGSTFDNLSCPECHALGRWVNALPSRRSPHAHLTRKEPLFSGRDPRGSSPQCPAPPGPAWAPGGGRGGGPRPLCLPINDSDGEGHGWGPQHGRDAHGDPPYGVDGRTPRLRDRGTKVVTQPSTARTNAGGGRNGGWRRTPTAGVQGPCGPPP